MIRPNRKTWAPRWLIVALVGIAPMTTLISSADAIAGSTRPVYVFAASDSDPQLARQRQINAAASSGFRERDMTVTVVAGSKSSSLRRRFGVPLGEFRVILVGKDGGVKLSSSTPVPAARFFGLIDAMPMRLDEMRSRGR